MTYAELRENVLVAVDTLREHKIRSGLTVLGIVIGVTSVIAVAAIISGLNRYIQQKVESLGSRTYFVARIPFGADPSRLPERIRVRKYLQYGDAAQIRAACPAVDYATTFGTRAFFFGQTNDVTYGPNRVERVVVRGAEPEYIDALPLFSIARGRFISRYDEDHARPVAVLGEAIANSLFPSSDPLGKTIRVNGQLYEVIGVFEHDAGLFGAGLTVDSFVITPLSDFKKRYPEAKELFIAFTVAHNASAEEAKDQVTEVMRRIRHIAASGEDDFEIASPDFLSTLWNQLTGALVILTGIISSVGLLVGGIGVMNIMLISVTERTKEIGVRKAIGARKADIRVQFLLEALTLAMIGGVLGILCGGMIAVLVKTLVPSVPATLSTFWVILGVAMSAGVGVFFGYYPANRAANLDPIVCLRYE